LSPNHQNAPNRVLNFKKFSGTPSPWEEGKGTEERGRGGEKGGEEENGKEGGKGGEGIIHLLLPPKAQAQAHTAVAAYVDYTEDYIHWLVENSCLQSTF